MAQRDRAAAVAAFDAIAADAALDQKLRDLAGIRAGLLLVDSAAFPDMAARLEALTAPRRAFRHSARELLALSAFRANDLPALRRWAETITTDAESPAAMRNRIEALLALTGVAKG